jgi:hypothetical protein
MLDYTCGTFPLAIWGKSMLSLGIVAILWPGRQAENSWSAHILLIIEYLRRRFIRERFRSVNSMNAASLFEC